MHSLELGSQDAVSLAIVFEVCVYVEGMLRGGQGMDVVKGEGEKVGIGRLVCELLEHFWIR